MVKFSFCFFFVKNGEWLPGTPERLKGSYVFVCCHRSRDRRCGVCGLALISRFKEEIELHGLQSTVSVSPCSHLGGHKYAGNVIVFGSKINGEVTGHWYGYVTPEDVQVLLEQHILKGEIVDWLWSYLTDPNSLISSASRSFQNEGLLSGGADTALSDAEFGLSRLDFRTSQLAGSVEFYQRHVFLCHKNPKVWPPRIEASEFVCVPRLLSAAVMAKKADMNKEALDYIIALPVSHAKKAPNFNEQCEQCKRQQLFHNLLSYLTDPNSLISSASRSFQNEGLLSGGADTALSDAEFGLSRLDFRTSQLAGSVEFYQRHVFLCHKNPKVWPPRIEASEFDRVPRLLSAAVMAKKADMNKELSISSVSAQILVLPLGKLMAAYLPSKPIRVPLTNWSFFLNPGPFNLKEHVLITIFANSGPGGVYALHIVTIVKAFYHRNISGVAAFILSLITQLSISSVSAQILVLPLGKLMAAYLPSKPIRVPLTNWSFSLNPGPFNLKEHVLITIFANSGPGGVYALHIVTIVKAFYHRNIPGVAAFILSLTTQMLVNGWAGLFRKYLVDSTYMWWPANLVQVSLFRALHEKEKRPKGGHTRLQFFFMIFVASCAYYIVPSYLFPSISALSLVYCIWKDSVTAQQFGGGISGLGLVSFGLDWSTVAGFLGTPLATPGFAIINILVGFMLFVYVIIPIAYWSNAYDAKKFPIFLPTLLIILDSSTTYPKFLMKKHLILILQLMTVTANFI
nr:oligopeptide transporter 5 [Quercus suber]